jgi:hypothetical protein
MQGVSYTSILEVLSKDPIGPELADIQRQLRIIAKELEQKREARKEYRY